MPFLGGQNLFTAALAARVWYIIMQFSDKSNASVIQAYNYGIVNGESDTEFAPHKQVSRQEMAKILVSTLTASEISMNIAEETDNLYLLQFTDDYDILIFFLYFIIYISKIYFYFYS